MPINMRKLIILIFILFISGCSSQEKITGGGLITKEFIVGGERVVLGSQMLGAGEEKFIPEVTMNRWDGETSIRIWSEEKGADTATQVGDKVVWETSDKTFQFYPLKATEQMDGGGFEFENFLVLSYSR